MNHYAQLGPMIKGRLADGSSARHERRTMKPHLYSVADKDESVGVWVGKYADNSLFGKREVHERKVSRRG